MLKCATPQLTLKKMRAKELKKRINLLHCMVAALEKTLEGVVDQFEKMAKRTANPGDLVRAENLNWYLSITTPACRKTVEMYHKRIVDLLQEICPEINGLCDRKQKSMLSFDTKGLRLQMKNLVNPNHLVSERPMDVHGIRIIVDGNDIGQTYVVARKILDFFSNEGMAIFPSTGTMRATEFQMSKFDDVVLPTPEEKKILSERYAGLYKDYNESPKGNGYQAIHFVVNIECNDNGKVKRFPLEFIVYTQVAFERVNREMVVSNGGVKEIMEDSNLETHMAYKNRQDGDIYAWMGEIPYLMLDGFGGVNRYDMTTETYTDELGLVYAQCYRLSTGDQVWPYNWSVVAGH